MTLIDAMFPDCSQINKKFVEKLKDALDPVRRPFLEQWKNKENNM